MLTLRQIEASLSLSRPVELYLFENGQTRYAYTSGSRPHLHADGQVYSPLAIKRGKIQRSAEDFKNKLTIEMPGDSQIPLLFRNSLPTNHVYLRVFRAQRDEKEKFINIFSGEVSSVAWNNSVATIECNPASALLRRQTLRMGYHAQCNHHLFDDMCGLRIEQWQEEVIVIEIKDSGYQVVIEGKSQPDAYYIAGLMSVNNRDYRTVMGIQDDIIDLMSPIDGLKPGDKVKLSKGCDRSAASCSSFNNFDNFFGCLTIPDLNPFEVY